MYFRQRKATEGLRNQRNQNGLSDLFANIVFTATCNVRN